MAPNVLKRVFKSERPGQKWATDVPEFKVKDQKLYRSPIIDIFNGEIVSYNLAQSVNFKQVTDMLKSAFRKLDCKTF
ncbi:DDE-type integrase/transposase/recombinase [Dyadobacter sp. CY326]|uniref:DDE-type integrase/transposase/recombinase n=1 Tax=Dyadobacter sp. CY326 TaxID=2907300 RepID=UPI0038D49EEC